MTKLNKKVTLSLLIFIVCVAVLPVLCCIGVPVSASAAQTGAENAASSYFAGGSGTDDDPYLISNGDQLLNISKNLSACYRLINDIDLTYYEWKPIGGYYHKDDKNEYVNDDHDVFHGTLDGDWHTISNLQRSADITEVDKRIYFGLFSRMGKNSTVKNLVMSNCKISMTGPAVNESNTRVFVGAIAGSVFQGNISNVSVYGTVSYNVCTNGMSYVGSIVGAANGARISNCTNRALITSGRYSAAAGGIAGYSSHSTFTGCTNYVTITAKCTSWGGSAAAGGIVGELYEKDTQHWTDYFVSCNNWGTLEPSPYSGISGKLYKGDMYAAPSPDEYYAAPTPAEKY